MAIEIYDLSCSSCRHTYMHTDASCLTVSCITSGNLWLFFLVGAWRKRECKWVQTAGAFLVARSDGGPGGLTHQPLVLPPPFRQKPTGEKVGRLLQQRDQMVQKVKSTAHSVSTTLLVIWAALLMPSWPTGVQRVWTAPPPNWHHVWAWEEVLPVNLTHACVFWTFRHNGCWHFLHLLYKLLYSMQIHKMNRWTNTTLQIKCKQISSSVFSEYNFKLFTQQWHNPGLPNYGDNNMLIY